MEFEFEGEIVSWRGPAPFHFVALPRDLAAEVRAVARHVTYGWGVIPVSAQVRGTRFTTSLFPKDGGYLVPIKDAVRAAERLGLGDVVVVHLTVEPRNR